MTGGNAPFVYCANAFSLGVEAINDPMGSNQRPWYVPTLRVCPALKGREGHEDPGEWWAMIPTLPAPQWTPLTIALFMYVSKMDYRNPGILLNTYRTAYSSGKKPPAAFRIAFLQYISTVVILVSLRKRGWRMDIPPPTQTTPSAQWRPHRQK